MPFKIVRAVKTRKSGKSKGSAQKRKELEIRDITAKYELIRKTNTFRSIACES